MQLFYRTYGTGAPIVMLHGLYASSDSWMGLVTTLSQTHRVILVDLRNHGRSFHSAEHSYPLMSDDLLSLLDKLSVKQAILVGHSMGGKVAMYFALHHPERVNGLIVEDISPLAYPSSHKNMLYHQNIIDTLLSLPISTYATRKEAEADLNQALADRSLSLFLLKNLYRKLDGKLEWRINLSSIAKNLSSIMDNIVNNVNKPFKTPCLFIKGDSSEYITAEDTSAIATFFPASSVTTIQDAGHWIHNTHQNEFLHSVNQYLRLLNSVY